jgi:hypothetical protein
MRVPKVGPVIPVESTFRSWFGGEAWFAATCPSCKGQSVWRGDQMVFPPAPSARVGPPPHPSMPPEVRELYDAAARVAAESRRAGAALARATAEQLIKIVDFSAPQGSTLAQRIERIRRDVSRPVAQMLDVVRHLGNKTLHGQDIADELVELVLDDASGPAVVEQLLTTINQLVEQLIVTPVASAVLWGKLPDGVKAQLPGAGAAGTVAGTQAMGEGGHRAAPSREVPLPDPVGVVRNIGRWQALPSAAYGLYRPLARHSAGCRLAVSTAAGVGVAEAFGRSTAFDVVTFGY